MGLSSSKPGSGSIAGCASSVMVSPILVSATFLMVALRNPTSPAVNWSTSTGLGVKTPKVSTSNARQNDHTAIGIEPGIENERLKLVGGPSFRRRNALDDCLQYFGDALSRLR